jgi:hypothetical protein
MADFDPNIEANLESKLIAVSKADMKLHLAKLELRDAICDALCSALPKESEVDDIIESARSIKVYKTLDRREKNMVVKAVYERLNNLC